MENKEIKIRKNTSEIIQIISSAASYFIIATILLKFIIEPTGSNNQVFVYGMFIVLAEGIIIFSTSIFASSEGTIGRIIMMAIAMVILVGCYLMIENIYLILIMALSIIFKAFHLNSNDAKLYRITFSFYIGSLAATSFIYAIIMILMGLLDKGFDKMFIVWGLIYYTGIFGADMYNTFRKPNKEDKVRIK